MAISTLGTGSSFKVIEPVGNTFTVDCTSADNFFLNLDAPIFNKEITFVGSKTFSTTLATNLSVPLSGLTGGLATSPSVGDIVIVSIGIASGLAYSSFLIAGYTQIAVTTATDTSRTSMHTGYKLMATTGDTTTDVVITNGAQAAGNALTGTVQVFRNVDNTVIFDVASVTKSTSNTALPSFLPITPISAGTRILVIGTGAQDTTAGFNYATTGLSDFKTLLQSGSSDSSAIGAGSFAWTNGTFTANTFTQGTGSPADTTANSNASIVIALRVAVQVGANINFSNIPASYKEISLYASPVTSITNKRLLTWQSGIVEIFKLPSSLPYKNRMALKFTANAETLYLTDSYLKSVEKTVKIRNTQTWTAPGDVSSVELILCGGGQSGIFGTNPNGGNGSAISEILDVTPGATYTITIGAGGAGNGVAGSSSSFGDLLTIAGAGNAPAGMGGWGSRTQGTTYPIDGSAEGVSGYGKGGPRALLSSPVENSGAGGGGGSTSSGNGGSGVAIIKYWSTT